jgi:hypothetical protein
MPRPYRLFCHCGAIGVEVDAELGTVGECNCSTCARHGYLHWKVPLSAVRLLTQSRAMTTYLWRDAAGHQFCPTCGVGMLRIGYPGDRVSVNARCLEDVDVFELTVSRYDGRHDMPPGPLPPR